MVLKAETLEYATPPTPAEIRSRRTRSIRCFYGHFAAAYGTCWLVLLGLALLTQSRIDTGLFGLIGFPVIGVVYAVIRFRSG